MENKKILIIKPSSLGDIIHAMPCALAIKKTFVNARISWLVKKEFAFILEGMPELEEIIVWDYQRWRTGNIFSKLSYILEMRKQLQAKRFDLVLDLQGLFKSTLLALLTGCSQKYVYSDAREGSAVFSKRIVGENAQAHVVQRYLDVVRYLGVQIVEPEFYLPITSKARDMVANLLTQQGIKDFVVLLPATRLETKEWLLERYAQLAERLLNKGDNVLIVGSNADSSKADYIVSHSKSENNTGKILDMTGKTDLKELMAVLEKANVVIGGDTGPLHMAVAAGSKVIGLFGQREPFRSGPYGASNISIWKPPSCAPCRKKVCADLLCMKAIDVDDVWTAYQTLNSHIEEK